MYHHFILIRCMIACLLVIVAHGMSRAQTPIDTFDWEIPKPASSSYCSRGFAMYLVTPMLGISQRSNLNDMLNLNGYPSIPSISTNWGFGMQYRWNKFTLGTDIAINRQFRVNPNEKTELSRVSLVANMDMKYYVYRNKMMTLYPSFSLATTQTNLYLTRQTAPVDVNELITGSGNAAHLQHFAGGFMLGAGIDFQRFCVEEDEAYPFYTIKIGYRFSPEGVNEWGSAYTTFINVPEDAFNTFFITLGIGAH